ncbi:MAG: VOC family protein [Myxococcota bacterium]
MADAFSTDLTAIPILRSPDLEATRDFYVGLGFDADLLGPGYLILRRPGIELHFCPPDHQDGRATESSCYIRGGGIDALHREWAAAGIECVSPIYRRPWGMYEFYVSDPHGCLLKFGRPVADGPAPEGALDAHPADRPS